ncbi:MAG TPA: asparagine synthase (glutamine-hydrolyzing), partial [bacterium]|nr:asparagine synthase (glutamine-hydrolyzing) [bacterium]
HYLLLKDGKLAEESYWQPSFKPGRQNLSLQDSVQILRDHIERSVAMRMVSDVPLGAFLSGGLDSSLVTAFLTRQSPRRVKTFSVAFEDSSFDESRYAQEMASYLGTEHYEERLTPRKMLEILPKIIDGLDEPFADASMIPTYLLCQHTRKQVTVAISGDAGDELFGGYPTYQAHKMAQWVPRWAARPLAKLADLLPVSDENISFDFKVKRFSAGLGYEPAVRNQIWLGSFAPEEKQHLFAEEIAALLSHKDEFSVAREQWNLCDSADYMNRIFHMDMRFYLQDDILVKVDRMSMANSLEVRVPYLDHKLVEFVCSLNSCLKLRGLTTKYILKQAAKGIIPDRIIDRPKKGFGIPVARWIKSEMKELIADTLSESQIRRGRFFSPAYVKKLLEDHHRNVKDNRKLLWTLFVFEAWRQKKSALSLV